MIEYSPPFAPLVKGEHESRKHDPETGAVLPLKWSARCAGCGESIEAVCDSGRVRERIAKWAVLHLHRDPLA